MITLLQLGKPLILPEDLAFHHPGYFYQRPSFNHLVFPYNNSIRWALALAGDIVELAVYL